MGNIFLMQRMNDDDVLQTLINMTHRYDKLEY